LRPSGIEPGPALMSAAGDDCAIDVRGVSKRYRFYRRPADRLWEAVFRNKPRFEQEVTVLQDVSFSVQRGETVGIIGRNGAGKTTLLQIIAGTLRPSTGSVRRNGRLAPLIELGSGFNPEFTGRENVIFSGTLMGMSEAEVRSRYDDIVAFADIGDYIERPVKTYSTGMYARLAFSVAIHIEPEILIIDEILSVGDAAFQRKCMNRFYQIRDRGCTILLVGHDEYMIRSVCSKALYLKQGRMVAFGDPVDVVGRYVDDTMTPVDAPPAAIAVAEAPLSLTDDPALPEGAGAADPCPGASDGASAGAAHETAAATALAIETSALETPDKTYRISHVELLDNAGHPVDVVHHGDDVHLEFTFEALTKDTPARISFVFNLYAVTGEYICGSTTLMEGYAPHPGVRSGRVRVSFPRLRLLTGKYHWRVAINDGGGLHVLQHAVHVCPFRVIVDDYKSAGLVHLDRSWQFELHS
jgi:lipopolysaccharide transport system ATP-binding protein